MGVPPLRGRRPGPVRTADGRGQGHPLRRRPLARRKVAGLRRQGQSALALRRRARRP
ncbi:MAG: hypothetical protein M0C28_35540 [Candidatus Moduliflexus flocculans]|nr:hypothetical protein [Candidatus Moduliflexus flocculans]